LVEADRRARQQVFEAERPDVPQLERPLDEMAQPGERLDWNVVMLERLDDRPQDGGVGVGNRDQDFVRPVRRQNPAEVPSRSENWNAVDTVPDARLVVADQTDR